jgi:hypothetical protein
MKARSSSPPRFAQGLRLPPRAERATSAERPVEPPDDRRGQLGSPDPTKGSFRRSRQGPAKLIARKCKCRQGRSSDSSDDKVIEPDHHFHLNWKTILAVVEGAAAKGRQYLTMVYDLSSVVWVGRDRTTGTTERFFARPGPPAGR